MKKFRMFRVFFLLFAVLFALSGCTGKTTVEQSGNAYTIYYLNTSGIQLVGSEYRTETTDLDALVRELLDKMGNVPADLDCQRALPERIEKITYRIEGNVLYLYADANYALMNSVQEILCRAALTKTLTQIPDIEYLSIYCAEQPITDAAGNPVGMLSASDFVDSIRDVNSFERTELTLYFANEAGDQLVEEKREVMQNSNTSLERLIVEQLIEGPQQSAGIGTDCRAREVVMPKSSFLPARFASSVQRATMSRLRWARLSLMVGVAAESCAPLFGDDESREVGYFESVENDPANSGGTKTASDSSGG